MPYKDPLESSTYQKRYLLVHRDKNRVRCKLYRSAHRDEKKVYDKQYHLLNKEKLKAKKKLYYLANIKKEKERRKRYYLANCDTVKARTKIYQMAHPEIHKVGVDRRRARIAGASVRTFTAKEWADMKLAHGERCAYCLEKVKLTQDHVVPLLRGGQHCASNIVPACMPCNQKKGTKLLLLAMN